MMGSRLLSTSRLMLSGLEFKKMTFTINIGKKNNNLMRHKYLVYIMRRYYYHSQMDF
jgi:hypothetical protein